MLLLVGAFYVAMCIGSSSTIYRGEKSREIHIIGKWVGMPITICTGYSRFSVRYLFRGKDELAEIIDDFIPHYYSFYSLIPNAAYLSI
mgnify:CR=1 FL=1